MLQPCKDFLKGDLLRACFVEHKFSYTIWNKAYSIELCKKAFLEIEDKHVVVSDDLYTNFILCYFANSYRGIKEKLYRYNFGIGVTGSNYLDLNKFKKMSNSLDVIPLMKSFLLRQAASQRFFNYYHTVKNTVVEGVIYQWRDSLSKSDANAAYQLLIEKLGASTVVSELASKYWNDQYELSDRICVEQTGIRTGNPVSCIGVYYHRLRNGGAEKVVAQLAELWQSMGYEVIMLTDEKPSVDDYPLSEQIRRIVIPSFQTSIEGKYKKRARYLENIIKKLKIDTIVYSSGTSHTIFWDACLIKGLGCNLVVETHSMFAGSMWYDPMFSSYLPFIYRMVDRVVSLSRVDITFWKNFCPATYIPNPITLPDKQELEESMSKGGGDKHNILWVGRLAAEKQPMDMIDAFSIVLETCPEATLTIVGEGDSDEWMDNMVALATRLRILDHIEFAGFQMDVSSYYEKADVFAFTSKSESLSLVLAESKSYGVPIVMYELPNTEMARDSRGVVSVPQGDVYAMAKQLVRLLEDKDERIALGRVGREAIEEYASFDIKGAWKSLFHQLSEGVVFEPDEDHTIMLTLLLQNLNRGIHALLANTNAGACGGNLYHLEAAVNRHEEVVNRHEEVVNRHEEVVNRHEEVVNRHEASINHQWEIQKWHEERLRALENQNSQVSLKKRLVKILKRSKKKMHSLL